MRPDGNMYEFGRIKPLRPNHTLWIRADWLENLGLEVPQTTEELFKVAEAFTKHGSGRQQSARYDRHRISPMRRGRC